MKTVLQELAILPGVIGSCISCDNTDVLASSLPAFFSNAMATDANSNIKRMMQMARVKDLSPQTMCIRYDKFTILAIPVDKSYTLLVLCEPSSNTSLVATTASMLGPEIKKKLRQPQKKEKTPPETANTDEQDYIYAKTTEALKQIKTALFDTVGPVADIVYDDCFIRWTEDNPADVRRIFELLGHISKEIDNDELFDEFKQRVSSLL
jgi:predicted regulator of Ras-like GTPase activity (Roadblock/LC7/MglB family)